MFEESDVSKIIAASRGKFPFHSWRRSGDKVMRVGSGLLTLSKFPVVRSKLHKYEEVSLLERLFGTKCFLETAFEIEGGHIVTVFNNHTTCGGLTVDSEKSVEVSPFPDSTTLCDSTMLCDSTTLCDSTKFPDSTTFPDSTWFYDSTIV